MFKLSLLIDWKIMTQKNKQTKQQQKITFKHETITLAAYS